jgi:hypothetical protein
MTEAGEGYEAKKSLEASRQAERGKDSSSWWFGQRNPIDRFTGWLVAWTAHTLQRTVVATQRPWISVKVERASGIHFHSDGISFQSFKFVG